MNALEDEIERLDRVILASENWAKNYTKNPEAHAKLIKAETKLNRVVRKYFKTLAKERVSSYVNWALYAQSNVQAYSFKVVVDVQEIIDEEEAYLMADIYEPLVASVALGAQTAEEQYKIDIGLNKFHESVMKATDKYIADLIKGINNTTADRIKQSISTSIKLGENTQSAIDRMKNVIGDSYRAELIARTETVRAYSLGITTFGVESNATSKVWEISSDPCPICEDNDGSEVTIDEDFPSGDSEPPAHPNCRCGISLVHDYGNGDSEVIDSESGD